MSKNIKTYLLLAVVLIIWGTIAYQLIGGVDTPNEQPSIEKMVSFKQKKVAERDSFTLLANYRDPFLGTVKRALKRTQNNNLIRDTLPKITVKYTGFINDKSTGKKIYFLTINGQHVLMESKQKIQNVQLLYGNKTAIQVLINGRPKKIALD